MQTLSARRPATLQCKSRARQLTVRVQAQQSTSDRSPEILTAFFFGRAFAIALNRRLSEAVIDVVSDISKALAERPQRLQDFQDEVTALARKEMSGSGFQLKEAATGTGSGGTAGGGMSGGAVQDPTAAIDELRAEIAYARAALNEIRASQRAAAAQN
ncbi:hypothetical protein TSOC_002586 [Tetrabaena socialis]|uniref:Uncharacterized protein n=1 Tax=Tetrabaena socialis TaxID=47790 RepID=A0A2J8ADQ4_9CHLO|nr:hypothetical protein TSOC_002586 [Tetrabaena socialis]|eukprot:PNH10642.1 hypothetical protein TSOC_002586 [Tetrabaena socialis]